MRFDIKLSPFSSIRAAAENAGAAAANWKDEVVDAAVIAGMSFFGTLGGMAAVGMANVTAAAISAGSIFFTTLALKRGLVKNTATS